MHIATFQCSQTPGKMKDFDSGLQGTVLGHNVGNRLRLFILVHPAHFDSMGHDHEFMALDKCSATNDCCSGCVLFKVSLSRRGVSCYQDIPTCLASSSNDFAGLTSSGLVDGLYNLGARLQWGSVTNCLHSYFIEKFAWHKLL
jgi:hypothetical protein